MAYRFALILLMVCFFTSCNSLFYYPDRVTYLTPDKKGFNYHEAKLETSDGEALNYWVIVPKGEKIGTILHFHGNAQNISAHFLFVAWFSEFGYEVISFDYRGYGQSSGKPTREGLNIDGKAMIELLESRKAPYFIVAQSLGGAVAIPAIASAASTNLKGLVLDSTFASYRGIARCKLAQHPITWALQWPLSYLVTDDLSPIDSVSDLKVPILQYQSEKDQVVPFEQGRKLFDSFKEEQIFVSLKRNGHTTAFLPPFKPYHDDLLAWLCRQSHHEERCKRVGRDRKKVEEEKSGPD